jgi:hypothetical protein
VSLFNMFEEELAEFGSVEEKRRYIAEQRLANPNWENTIFSRGKAARGETWVPCHRGVTRDVLKMMGGGGPVKNGGRNGAKPRNGRKARAH